MTTKFLTLCLGATLAATASATAATRSSASYSVPLDAIEAAGQRISSAAYTIDGAVGSLAGIGTAAAPELTAKHGYAGQLYDLAGLALSASPTNVNEGATRQLHATASLDDATLLNVAPSALTWSVETGPIDSIDGSGLASAGVVYQHTPATVRGAYRGHSATLGLLVLNVENDNFGAYAGDGVDDNWQVSYFGLDNPQAAAGGDPDGDGQTNRFEYMAGTIPTDFLSKFQLSIEEVSGQPTHKDVVFSPRYPSRSYTVQYCPDFNAGLFLPLTGAATNDNGAIRTVTDLNANDGARFYRVQISYP